MLDYVDNLSVIHVRQLFALLVTLSFRANSDDPIDDEVAIFIRKLLTHASDQDKRMGVTAVAAAVKAICVQSAVTEETCLPGHNGMQINAVLACWLA